MRHTPEAGAVCGNPARTDLRGGRGVNLRSYRNTAANYHARAIVIRALDWVLHQAKCGAEIEIIDGNFRTLVAPDQIFPVLAPAAGGALTPFLTLGDLKQKCENEQLYFSDNLYQSIAISINLGRHLILTGPPGCGKSRLAAIIGLLVTEKFAGIKQAENQAPKIVTASPAWTSGEVIGRYFPSPDDNKLVFHPGVFLEAIEDNRCLIIDEFNRANMDECFGELFTVLSGQSCDLPYQHIIDDDENNVRRGVIKIVPKIDGHDASFPNNKVYVMDGSFRLIGTMNDFDRSALHQLSFALLRRFDVINVSHPSGVYIQSIINNRLGPENAASPLFPTWGNDLFARNLNRNFLRNTVFEIAKNLFVENNFQNALNCGLIRADVVGASVVGDVLDFVLNGLNPSRRTNLNYNVPIGFQDMQGYMSCAIKSLTALALVVKIIPQMADLDFEKFNSVISTVRCVFGNAVYKRISVYLNGENLEFNVLVDGHEGTVFNFFAKELRNYYKHTPRSDEINRVVPE